MSLRLMTWRRFCVLLSGLSPESRLMNEYGRKTNNGKLVTDPRVGERALKAWAK